MTDTDPLDTSDEAANLDFGDLKRLLGFHLRMAQVVLHRDFLSALSHLDLTQRQWAVLHLISANPGVSQAELATALDTDRATMMATVDRLENRDFLLRQRSDADRRRSELRLTTRGRATLQDAERAIERHEMTFRTLFSEEELAWLIEALDRIRGAGSRSGGGF